MTTTPRPTTYGQVDWQHKGPVHAWQEHLVNLGEPYASIILDNGGIDGRHFGATERATKLLQKAASLESERGVPLQKNRFSPLIDRWIPAANYTAVECKKNLIVLHSIESIVRDAAAVNTAWWFNGRNATAEHPPPRVSSHYITGPNVIVGCVPDSMIAWTAPSANADGINIEQTGRAQSTDWQRGLGLRTLLTSARLCAELAERHDIPIRVCTAEDMLDPNRRFGITLHTTVTDAILLAKASGHKAKPFINNDGSWKSTNHRDPAYPTWRWPWDVFLAALDQ